MYIRYYLKQKAIKRSRLQFFVYTVNYRNADVHFDMWIYSSLKLVVEYL